jgi:site-specific DNA-methyltransferase (adenine-specific)
VSRNATIDDVLHGRARWCVVCADNKDVLPTLGDKSVAHVITDPPYSEHVHGKQRRMLRGSGGRSADGQAAGRGLIGPADLGFVALDAETRDRCADEFSRLVWRWILVFTNAEGQSAWETDLTSYGLRHIRVGAWVKVAAQPQLTGDRPGVGFEAIEIAHGRERCRWNNGGHHAVWTFAIATDRNGYGDRVHTTQKPVDLMLALVEQFTDPDELVLDPFAGSGTTGVACLRLGRRFIGIEREPRYAEVARERLEAESRGLSLSASRAGQTSIFDVIGEP